MEARYFVRILKMACPSIHKSPTPGPAVVDDPHRPRAPRRKRSQTAFRTQRTTVNTIFLRTPSGMWTARRTVYSQYDVLLAVRAWHTTHSARNIYFTHVQLFGVSSFEVLLIFESMLANAAKIWDSAVTWDGWHSVCAVKSKSCKKIVV